MAINFSDTLSSIHADLSQRNMLFSTVLGCLLLCWLMWLFWVPLSITKQAQGFIEINQPALSLVAATAGRVEFVKLRVGDEVAADTPLIKINSDDEVKQIALLNQSIAKQKDSLVALNKTQESELRSLNNGITALEQKIKNILVQVDNVQAQFDQQAKTVALLNSANSAVSKIELQREQLQLKQIQERLLSKQQESANLHAEHRQLLEHKDSQAAKTTQDNSNQQSRIAALEGTLSQQEQLLKHKTLSVSKPAKVAEVMPLQTGQWINAGEQLATLLPQGDLRVLAQFKPVDAQGYLQLGQKAKIHVDNFPWLQYGALNAKVVHIDQAERNGMIRVLLELESNNHLALQHGMSASINVSVASATPWQLLLQSLGRRSINF